MQHLVLVMYRISNSLSMVGLLPPVGKFSQGSSLKLSFPRQPCTFDIVLHTLSPFSLLHPTVPETGRVKRRRYTHVAMHTSTILNVHHHLMSELLKKVKIHLNLHLTQNMADFGHTSTFNTERYSTSWICLAQHCTLHTFHRCETFNSLIRARNINANRLAPSRDIAEGFATIEHLHFICSRRSIDGSSRSEVYLHCVYE